MPFFKLNGIVMHIKMAKPRRKKCQFCSGTATRECDYVVSKTLQGEEITCDANMCGSCARPVGEDKDFCPRHA